MSPQAGASARRQAVPGSPQHRAERTEPRRHPLRLVERAPRRRRRVARKLAGATVVVSLVGVVVGHAVLAEEQVRLSIAESQLTAEQSVHRQDVLALAQRETPGRVVSQAAALHMVTPGGIIQLPYVPLDSPLATPTVAPAPAGSTVSASATTQVANATSKATPAPRSVPAPAAPRTGTSTRSTTARSTTARSSPHR